MTESAVMLITLVVYQLVLVGIGFLAKRRTHNSTDFYLGGRRLGPVVAALSASASSSSAWTLLSVSGSAWLWGLGALWLFPACVGGFALNWYVVAPALNRLAHQSGAITLTDVLAGPRSKESRSPVRQAASAIILCSLLAYVASQFRAAGLAFQANFGSGFEVSLLAGALVVVLYTLLGGFWAVSLTDTLQGLMMALAALLLPLAALIKVGGPAALLRGLLEVQVPGYLSLWRNLPPAAGVGFILGLLGIGLGYPGQPHVVNRFMALRRDRLALRTARRVAMAWALVIYGGMLTLGFCGRVLLPDLQDKEALFYAATSLLFHPLVAGVMLAAVLSAIMSTADSQLLVAASAITHDLGFKGRSHADLLLRSRLVVVFLSLLALVPALFVGQDIFHMVLFAWSAMGAAFGPALLVTLWRGPCSKGRVLVSMLTGFLMSVGAFELRAFSILLQPEWSGIVERVLAFLAALAVLLWPARGAAASPRSEPPRLA